MSNVDRKAANWMARFEDLVTDSIPSLIGKMDWDTATYLYREGLDANAAAKKVIENHPLFCGFCRRECLGDHYTSLATKGE